MNFCNPQLTASERDRQTAQALARWLLAKIAEKKAGENTMTFSTDTRAGLLAKYHD